MSSGKERALELLHKYVGDQYGLLVSIKRIHNGYTNESYLAEFEKGNKKFQVRLPNGNGLVNRVNEHRIITMMGDQKFLYFDTKTGEAVKEWIEGKNPRIPKFRRWKYIDELFSQIKKIHQTPLPPGHRFKIIDTDAYNDNLYRLKLNYQTKFLGIIEKYDSDIAVLSHTDINWQNIIVDPNGKLHLIDYEWVALVSDYFDYANFIRESGIRWYTKINWGKYINRFNLQKLKDIMFVASVYAYLWTWKMPQTAKIKRYRRKTLRQVNFFAKGVVHNENK